MSRCVLFISIGLLIPAVLILNSNQLPAQDKNSPPAKYAEAIRKLESWIERERIAKGIPSLSIAMVDDQNVVWTQGFGSSDPETKSRATSQTLYRVGSVSKPVTSLLLMLFVQMGILDLDEPVEKYLPEFHPKNPFKKKITLRQMVSHRSGLVRETPVGSYFDDNNPSLKDTVLSINKTELIYEPTTKTAYSNIAPSIVGYLLQKKGEKPFAELIQKKLLNPIGMTSSSFDPSPEQRKKISHALMWSYQGREFPAPKFDLGTAPAGCLYASAEDMAKLLTFLFRRGSTDKGQLLKADTLEQMWKPQFVKKGTKEGFGLGFFVSEFAGHRKISHGGAVYGFATEFAALPDAKVGVCVMAARDVANGLTRRIGDMALRYMLAVKEGKPLPKIEQTEPVSLTMARELAGTYRKGKKSVEVTQLNGKVWLLPSWTGRRAELRRADKGFILDDMQEFGLKVVADKSTLKIGKETFQRDPNRKPAPCPEKFLGLIGEYGWDHNILYILEKEGQLYALIEWFFLYPLTEVSENIYEFPDFGLYHGDKLVFKRDEKGKAVEVNAANVIFPRRKLDGENGQTFKIQPTRSLAELRKLSAQAKPPRENREFRKPNLVEVQKLDPTIKLDIRYASKNNFLGTPFYTSAKAFLQRPAAQALVRVNKKLKKQGYGLLIHDGYRPWQVTKMFWDATPLKYHHFVADPKKGSRHNRGCAVDLTLYDLKTGQPVEMVSGYDEFSDRSYPLYFGGTSLQRWHRDLLRGVMESEGFSVYEAEWWHFDFQDWASYPILNAKFEEVK